MKKLAFIGVLIVISLLMVGCHKDEVAAAAKMSMALSPSSVSVASGEISSQVKVTLKKLDATSSPQTFNIVLITPNASEVAFYDDNGKPITRIATQTFTNKDDQNTYTFRVKGQKLGSTDYSPYTLTLQLEQYGTSIGAPEKLSVKVT
jgi:hypothetical protein